jgi:tryptophan 2,3-dioxygenase
MSARDLDPGLVRNLAERMTYSDYLQLDQLLGAQRTLSEPPHHDELLFIIIHQATELWLKLVVHELRAARDAVARDDLEPAFKILARVKHIQTLLQEHWGVLETLTPSEYTQFRGVLGSSSGFQSVQYRTVEFLLGNKDEAMVRYHEGRDADVAQLEEALADPSLYDAFLAHLARQGLPVPPEVLTRDLRTAHAAHDGVTEVFRQIYADPHAHWNAYEMAEKLLDVDEAFSLWRFRHMKVVERVIGFKRGTGGSEGVPFLRRMVTHTFFPELWAVRTSL